MVSMVVKICFSVSVIIALAFGSYALGYKKAWEEATERINKTKSLVDNLVREMNVLREKIGVKEDD